MILSELTWPEVEEMDRDTVVVYPIAALEQHSKHLPFFTDSILCGSIAERLEVALPNELLLLPVQWLGASAHHLGMTGTLSAENETYLRLLVEPLRCLLRKGFHRAFFLNGHGGNIDAFHLALRQLAVEFPNAELAGASYWDFAAKEIAATLDGKLKQVGHACEFETSLMLYLRPELVRRDEISDGELIKQPEAMSAFYIPLDMRKQTKHGGAGQATLANAEKGEKLLNMVVSNGVSALRMFRARKN